MSDAQPTIYQCSPKFKLLESNGIMGDPAGSGVVVLVRCSGKKVVDLIGWLSVYLQYMKPPISRRKRRTQSLQSVILQLSIIQCDYININFLNVRQASTWGSVSWKVDLTQFRLSNEKTKLTAFQITSSHMFLELCCWTTRLLTPMESPRA
jgi:hypothetical protein